MKNYESVFRRYSKWCHENDKIFNSSDSASMYLKELFDDKNIKTRKNILEILFRKQNPLIGPPKPEKRIIMFSDNNQINSMINGIEDESLQSVAGLNYYDGLRINSASNIKCDLVSLQQNKEIIITYCKTGHFKNFLSEDSKKYLIDGLDSIVNLEIVPRKTVIDLYKTRFTNFNEIMIKWVYENTNIGYIINGELICVMTIKYIVKREINLIELIFIANA